MIISGKLFIDHVCCFFLKTTKMKGLNPFMLAPVNGISYSDNRDNRANAVFLPGKEKIFIHLLTFSIIPYKIFSYEKNKRVRKN